METTTTVVIKAITLLMTEIKEYRKRLIAHENKRRKTGLISMDDVTRLHKCEKKLMKLLVKLQKLL